MKHIIVSLCDFSGAWSRPFVGVPGYVIRVDPKHDPDYVPNGRGLVSVDAGDGKVRTMKDGGMSLALSVSSLRNRLAIDPTYLWRITGIPRIYWWDATIGILMAPPCTDFAISGARWFKAKDGDGRTAESVRIVRDCLHIRNILAPDWWVLENPVGRVARLVPELGKPKMYFHPWEYAGLADDPDSEAYTKKTALWGDFNTDLRPVPRDPVMYERGGKRGSWMWANLGGKSERTKELRSMTPTGFAWEFASAQMRQWRNDNA